MRWHKIIFVIIALGTTATAADNGDKIEPVPSEDFYAWVNEDWLRRTEIPSDVPWISPFVVNTLRAQHQVREIVEESIYSANTATSETRQIASFYASFTDLRAVEQAGLTPLDDVLGDIEATSSKRDFAPLFGHLATNHTNYDPNSTTPSVVPIRISVWNDRLDVTQTVLVLHPGGLGLPNRAYYLDPAFAESFEQYREHVQNIFAIAGIDDPGAAAAAAIRIETELAKARLPEEDLHDAVATWNLVSASESDDSYPGFKVSTMLRGAGFEEQKSLVVTEPKYFKRLGQLLEDMSVDEWQSYLRWQILRRYSEHLPQAFRDADFDFYGRVIFGNETPRPRGELGSLAAETAFPNTLGRLWVNQYVDPRTKPTVTRMAEAVRRAFANRIRRNGHYTPETKSAALDKLRRLRIEIAYPDIWPEDATDLMKADDLIGNLRKLSAAATRDKIVKLSRPADRGEWYTSPQDTSGYYVRSTNTLAIPAGLLQWPWFDPDASMAENYGGVGTVIGHEIAHAFDDQGAQFDASGNLANWWVPVDTKIFAKETEKLVRQYENFEVFPSEFLNGRLTVSEAYGDLVGLTVAYDALEAEHFFTRDPSMLIDFLVSFCTHWRAKYREPLLRRIVASDGHAPQRFRCNGPVSAFAPYYEAFDVGPGDAMYLPIDDRPVPF